MTANYEEHRIFIFEAVRSGSSFTRITADLAGLGCRTTPQLLARWVKRRAAKIAARAELVPMRPRPAVNVYVTGMPASPAAAGELPASAVARQRCGSVRSDAAAAMQGAGTTELPEPIADARPGTQAAGHAAGGASATLHALAQRIDPDRAVARLLQLGRPSYQPPEKSQ